jgi:hypothetical protein
LSSAIGPHHLVGAVGVVLVLGLGAAMAAQWEQLVGVRTWEIAVDTHAASLPQRSGTVAPGQRTLQTFPVPHENVTDVRVRVTWDEGSLGQNEVTLLVHEPTGTEVGRANGRGGVAGLTVERELHPTPEGGRVRTAADAEDALARRVPTHPETRGPWRITIDAAQSTSPGSTALSYRLTMDYVYYTARLVEPAPTAK